MKMNVLFGALCLCITSLTGCVESRQQKELSTLFGTLCKALDEKELRAWANEIAESRNENEGSWCDAALPPCLGVVSNRHPSVFYIEEKSSTRKYLLVQWRTKNGIQGLRIDVGKTNIDCVEPRKGGGVCEQEWRPQIYVYSQW